MFRNLTQRRTWSGSLSLSLQSKQPILQILNRLNRPAAAAKRETRRDGFTEEDFKGRIPSPDCNPPDVNLNMK